ncbi:hypothetical protein [Mycobacterium gallinarum]|nr:hypothetical protein [Mycobacterium gallinarum]
MGRGRTRIHVLKRMLCVDCRSPYVRIWITFDSVTREADQVHFNQMIHDNSCPSAIPGQRCVDNRLPTLTVNEARSMKTWRTELIENLDGEPGGVGHVDEQEHALGWIGPASPCCDADGDDHTSDCAYAREATMTRDDVNEWLRRGL